MVHHHRRYSSWRSVHFFKRLCNVSFCFCFPRRWRRRSTTLLVQALRLLCAAPQLRTHDATPTDCDLSTAPGASTCCRCRRAPRTLDVQCSGAARGGTDEALDGGAPRARGVNLRAMLRARCTAMPSSRHRDVWSRRFSVSMPTAGAAVGGRPSSGARRAPAAARRGDSAKSSACDASRWVPHALGGANAALPRRGSYCVGAFSSSASRESSRDRRDVHAARALRSGRWGERCRRARHGAARASRAGPLRAMRRRRIATWGADDSHNEWCRFRRNDNWTTSPAEPGPRRTCVPVFALAHSILSLSLPQYHLLSSTMRQKCQRTSPPACRARR